MDAGFCFGVAKVVDEQLQQFLEDVAPGHRFTSGLFLSGFKSRVMQANDDLAAIKQKKKKLLLSKPIYAGMCILDLSKLHMFKFHYDVIKAQYGSNASGVSHVRL